jgi:hypothetical protein
MKRLIHLFPPTHVPIHLSYHFQILFGTVKYTTMYGHSSVI